MEERGYSYVHGKDGKPTLLGKGAFGKVYFVVRDGNTFITKDIWLDERSERQRRRARHEIKVLETLDHPNIVHLYECWEDSNVVTMVMEYVSDNTLRDSIARQRELSVVSGHGFLEAHILTWSVQICLALEYMHSLRFLHRDLRSENVFVTTDNVIKLGDFGIATVLSYAKDAAISFRGPPHCLAPELFVNSPYSTYSDMWSFGCLIHEMATLQRPFESNEVQEIMKLILRADPTPLGDMYSSDLQGVVTLLLQKTPESRPSANEVLHMGIFKRHLQGFKRRLQEQCTLMKRASCAGLLPRPDPTSPLDPNSRNASHAVRLNGNRRGSRLVMEGGDGELPVRRSSIRPDDFMESETAAMLPGKVMINFGTDRQRMKAFLQGPPPEDVDFGADAEKLQAFLEGPPLRCQQGPNRRRSEIQVQIPPEVRYSREGTAEEHQSILGHLVRLYTSPRTCTTYTLEESDSSEYPPEEMEGRDAEKSFFGKIDGDDTLYSIMFEPTALLRCDTDGQFLCEKDMQTDDAIQNFHLDQELPDDERCGDIVEDKEGVAEDTIDDRGGLVEDHSTFGIDDAMADSDVCCASPRSRPYEVEDEAFDGEEDLYTTEVEEEDICDSESLSYSPHGSSSHLKALCLAADRNFSD